MINKYIIIEFILIFTSLCNLLSSIVLCLFIDLQQIIKIQIIILFLLLFLISVLIGIRLEQKAGPYICKECGKKYNAKYIQLLLSPHIGFTKYIRCPKCNKKSWNNKIIRK